MLIKALEHLLGLHSHIRPAISPPCSHNATPARRQCHPPGDKAIINLVLDYQSLFPIIFCSPRDISPSQLILFFPVPLHISRVRTYCGVPQPHSHACSYLQVERSVHYYDAYLLLISFIDHWSISIFQEISQPSFLHLVFPEPFQPDPLGWHCSCVWGHRSVQWYSKFAQV